MLNFSESQFRYVPYPIGLFTNVFEPDFYDQLVTSFPPVELFEFKQTDMQKLCLSETSHPDSYHEFIAGNTAWREFHACIKSNSFVSLMLETLRGHNIDLGLGAGQASQDNFVKQLARLVSGRRPVTKPRLRARFEFSVLMRDRGCIQPHTDAATKVITLVLSMTKPGDWQDAWGGGTEVVFPKDHSLSFNYQNRYLTFDDVDPVEVYSHHPNQCILFVKTYNSWHCVRPLQCPADAMRRSVTVNIELLD